MRDFAEHHATAHEAPFAGIEIGARVRGATVVPGEQIAHLPDMLVDPRGVLGVVEKLREQAIALGAQAVTSHELMRRLRASGLRVRKRPSPDQRRID